MIEAMVIVVRAGAPPEGRGRKQFRVCPRVGECIEFSEGPDRVGYLYRVLAIHHAGDQPADTAGDIYVQLQGRTVDVLKSYGGAR